MTWIWGLFYVGLIVTIVWSARSLVHNMTHERFMSPGWTADHGGGPKQYGEKEIHHEEDEARHAAELCGQEEDGRETEAGFPREEYATPPGVGRFGSCPKTSTDRQAAVASRAPRRQP